jgi:hypothetical protein
MGKLYLKEGFLSICTLGTNVPKIYLMDAARTIDLRVLDHLIVGKEGYCSFVESRLMPGS